MNEIEEFIVHMNGHAPGHASLTSAAVDRLRLLYAEIDVLRAEWDELVTAYKGMMYERDIAHQQRDQLRATVADQERQIETAREIIGQLYGYIDVARLAETVDDWLAANSPKI